MFCAAKACLLQTHLQTEQFNIVLQFLDLFAAISFDGSGKSLSGFAKLGLSAAHFVHQPNNIVMSFSPRLRFALDIEVTHLLRRMTSGAVSHVLGENFQFHG